MKHPRVTEILKNFTNYEHIPQQILGRAAARGTSVHALCAGIAQGAWIPDGMIDEELVGYVNSFKKWSEVQVKSFLIIEERYTNEELKYSGQVDFCPTTKDISSSNGSLQPSSATSQHLSQRSNARLLK